jgi:hypothetical protein
MPLLSRPQVEDGDLNLSGWESTSADRRNSKHIFLGHLSMKTLWKWVCTRKMLETHHKVYVHIQFLAIAIHTLTIHHSCSLAMFHLKKELCHKVTSVITLNACLVVQEMVNPPAQFLIALDNVHIISIYCIHFTMPVPVIKWRDEH